MSSEDDEYLVKLDANIEVETIVRNRFEEIDDLCYNDPLSNLFAQSSDEEQLETSVESSQASADYRDIENVTSAGSDASDNPASAVSDVSAESTDSMDGDAPTADEEVQEQATTSREEPYFSEFRLKHVNCKELIIFCIDMSAEMERVPYIINKQSKHSPLSMMKRAIGMFVHNKHFFDKKHEYALMVLYDTATWVSEFTKNPNQLVDSLEDLTETVECNTCDLSSVITLLNEKFPNILSSDFQSADIHCVFRVILLYGRSNCMIEFSDPTVKETLSESPSLFLDIIYIHEPPSDENKCKEIYDALCSLDNREKSYIFETTRSITALHNIIGKLLAHPFQRVPQKKANYKLRDVMPY